MGGDAEARSGTCVPGGSSARRVPRERERWDGLRGWLGHARARSWPSVGFGAALLALLGFVGQNQAVLLPMVDRTIDLRTVYVVVGVLVVTVPLQVTIPDLARTLPRERALRAVRPLGAVVMLGLVIVPSVPWGAPAGALADVRLATVLLAVALVAATLVGPRGWIVSFGAGMGGLLLDGSYSQPVTVFLGEVGLGPLVLILVLAICVAALAPVRARPAAE